MSKKAKDDVAAASAVDEHHGKGGSYIVDPATGNRVLEERTLSRDEANKQGEGEDHGTA
jgi:hypothetical protein